jgi:hypothetical protein
MRLFKISTMVFAAVFGLTVAIADVGDPLTLTVLPDEPVGSGDVVSFDLSDGTPMHFAVLFFGEELGQFPLGEITLDLIPTGLLPLFFFDMDGNISYDFTVPDDLPPEISGLLLNLQAASFGIDWGGSDDLTVIYRVSNLDSIEFK